MVRHDDEVRRDVVVIAAEDVFLFDHAVGDGLAVGTFERLEVGFQLRTDRIVRGGGKGEGRRGEEERGGEERKEEKRKEERKRKERGKREKEREKIVGSVRWVEERELERVESRKEKKRKRDERGDEIEEERGEGEK